MASAALISWQTDRTARLGELYATHTTIGGLGPGKRFRTEQLNQAIVLRLSGEFQAFARDLHDLVASEFSAQACVGNPVAESIVRSRLTENRQIDKGNVQAASLGADFGRFGLGFWPTLVVADGRTAGRQKKLGELNQMRNDIAHVNPGALSDERYAVTLSEARHWHSAVDALAVTMDNVLSKHLSSVFNYVQPW